MTTRHLVDPELSPLGDNIPRFELTSKTVGTPGSIAVEMEQIADCTALNVQHEEITIRDLRGDLDGRCLVYRPETQDEARPTSWQFHGGGTVLNHVEFGKLKTASFARVLCLQCGVSHA